MATCVRSLSESVLPTFYHGGTEPTTKRPNLTRNATTYAKLPQSGNSKSSIAKYHWYRDVKNDLSIALTPNHHDDNDNTRHDRISFLDLPAELRLQIYHLVFHDAKIRLVYGDLVNGNEITPLRGLNFPNAILQTCKAVRAEAMPVLQQNVILQVNWAPNYNGQRLSLDLPSAWRDRVQYAHFASLREALLKLDSFAGLKEVVIGYHLYDQQQQSVSRPLRSEDDAEKVDVEVARMQVCALPEVKIAKRAFLTEAVDGLRIRDGVRVKMLLHVHEPRAARIGTKHLLIDVLN